MCTEGYTCGSDFACAPGDLVADSYYHGCRRKTCSEVGCAVNYTCRPEIAPPNDCVKKTCAKDGDCDCGACVFGGCESRPFMCVFEPA